MTATELTYIKTFLKKINKSSLVRTFSDIKKIDHINSQKRILIYPSELMNIDGKFYKKRYRVQLSEPSEAALTTTFNTIINNIDTLNKGITIGAYSAGEDNDYDSTHTFTDDTDGTDPSGFTIVETTGTVEVEAIKDEHLKVVKTVSTGGTDATMALSFPSIASATVEWWWFTTGLGTYPADERVRFYNGATEIGHLYITNNDVFWFDMIDDQVMALEVVDSWIHMNFVWSGNDIAVIIGGTAYGAGENFLSPNAVCDKIVFGTGDSTACWYNSIGVSWDDSYQIGDNHFLYEKPDVLTFMEIAYGNRAYEHPKTKRWTQDLWLDVEWSTE